MPHLDAATLDTDPQGLGFLRAVIDSERAPRPAALAPRSKAIRPPAVAADAQPQPADDKRREPVSALA